MLSSRFRVLCADAGLSIEATAQLLHVTPRTVRYWFSGRVTVPYAAYKLVRVMRLFELPCAGWDGWHMHSGKLWSPEGHGFEPHDSNWWGLLVRKARLFGQMYDRERQLDIALYRMGAGRAAGSSRASFSSHELDTPNGPTGNAGRAAQPPGLYLSLRHIGTINFKTANSCGLQPGSTYPAFGQYSLTKVKGDQS